jgi:hypothetical protein
MILRPNDRAYDPNQILRLEMSQQLRDARDVSEEKNSHGIKAAISQKTH